jgi:hypothetical protein
VINRLAFCCVLDQVTDGLLSTALDPRRPVRPPTLLIGLRQHHTFRQEEDHVVMDTTGLVLLSDPHKPQRHIAATRPLPHMIQEFRDMAATPIDVRSVGQGKEDAEQSTSLLVALAAQKIARTGNRLKKAK